MATLRALPSLVALAWLSAPGCGGTWPAIIEPADIVQFSEGTPRISRVRDIGGPHIGQAGPLAAESDGVFTAGEMVLVEGRGFGKQPTVRVSGRPAEVLWRTRGGGLITRLPAGAPAGEAVLVVETGGGRDEARFPLRRLGLVLDRRRGLVHVLDVRGGPGTSPDLRRVGEPLRLPGAARALAIDASGAAGYVLLAATPGGPARVALIDLVAPGGPRLLGVRALAHPAYAVVAAARAPVVALVGRERITLWDTNDPRRPAPWPAAALPEAARGATMAALDPAGALLALGVPEGNQVLLVSVKPGKQAVKPEVRAQAAALPEARQPLLVRVRFAADGETVWALAGDNPQSLPTGHQAARVLALRLELPPKGDKGLGLGLALYKTVDLPQAGVAIDLALGRALPPASGAAIRVPPERTTFFVSARAAPGQDDSEAPGSLLLKSNAGGAVGTIYSGGEPIGGLDLTPDTAVALSVLCPAGPQGLAALAAHAESENTYQVSLGPAEAADEAEPPEVAVQP